LNKKKFAGIIATPFRNAIPPFTFTDYLVCDFQGGDLSSYTKSGEWEIVEFSTEQHKIVYGCCPEPYYDVTYYLKLRRQVLYYAIYFIIPCALIALLAATIFLLPQDCSERITVGKLVESFRFQKDGGCRSAYLIVEGICRWICFYFYFRNVFLGWSFILLPTRIRKHASIRQRASDWWILFRYHDTNGVFIFYECSCIAVSSHDRRESS
jgi:hypothetical protein